MMKAKAIDREKLYFIFCGIVLLVLCLLSLRLGSVYIKSTDFFKALVFCGDDTYSLIIHSVRLPRLWASLVAGAGLSVSGYILQTVTDNKMASPNLIGVSQGAGFGVIVMLCFFPGLYFLTPVIAFAGGFACTLLIVAFSKKMGLSKGNLILTGLALGSIMSAGISFLSLLDSDALVSYNAFSIGSVSGVGIYETLLPAVMVLFVIVLSAVLSKKLDILMLGDKAAFSLGERASLLRIIFMLLACASAGAVVSFAGLLGFVGLMAPHIARRFVKNRAKHMIWACALTGMVLVSAADLVGRVAFAPGEIPVGIIMSLIGAPFFLAVLLTKGGERDA